VSPTIHPKGVLSWDRQLSLHYNLTALAERSHFAVKSPVFTLFA